MGGRNGPGTMGTKEGGRNTVVDPITEIGYCCFERHSKKKLNRPKNLNFSENLRVKKL